MESILIQKHVEMHWKNIKYNKIFCTNIEAPDYTDEGFAELESLSFEFDYIALIDILEHVINPTKDY